MLLNGGFNYAFGQTNLYRSPLFGATTFRLQHAPGEWDVLAYSADGLTPFPARRTARWPIAQGGLMSTPKTACIFMDNAKRGERLILDHVDPAHPMRAIVKFPSAECTCPLTLACLNPRAD